MRVKDPNESDWNKLVRLMKFLNRIVLRDRHSMMLVGLNSGLTIANETAIMNVLRDRHSMALVGLSSGLMIAGLAVSAATARATQLLCSTTENVTIDNLV